MRIKHPERYKSYRDINHVSPAGRIVWMVVISLILIGIGGGVIYQQVQNHQRSEQVQLNSLKQLTKNVANLDTEVDAIDYLKYTATPIERLKIGTPVELTRSISTYNKELTGYNYPIVDYFKIKQSKYYLRLIFTSNTNEKFQTMLLNEQQYRLYQQFDQLQYQFAQSIKTSHEYDANKLTKLQHFKQQHPELHN